MYLGMYDRHTGMDIRLTQERHTGWIYGAQLLLVLLVVVGNQLIALLQYLLLSRRESLYTIEDNIVNETHARCKQSLCGSGFSGL